MIEDNNNVNNDQRMDESSFKNAEKLPWIEKYRPKFLIDMIDHQEKIDTIKNLISRHELPHLLFYGPPGSGKTSMILAIAREIYGENDYKKYILEINASGDRGIDTVRTNVMNFVKSRSDQVKLVILDEADAMTTDAQRALHNIIEKSSKYARFCLICNNINKVLDTVKSRCVKMRFGCINQEKIKGKLDTIIQQEGIQITDDAISTLLANEKDFRQILNVLQGLYFLHQDVIITSDHVYRYLGKPDVLCINQVIHTLFNQTFDEGYKLLLDMYRSNLWNLEDLLDALRNKILTISLNFNSKGFLIAKMAEIEFRIKMGRDSETQLIYLASCFQIARTMKV